MISCLIVYSLIVFPSPVYFDFPRKEIMDDINDVKIINLGTGKVDQNRSFNSYLTAALDIQRVAFSEKMDQLNSTMWIGNNLLKTKDIYSISSMAYGILIDSDKDSSTGTEGVA